jgi:hypothetical protein
MSDFFQLNKQMEKCMAAVNSNLLKHNLMMAIDDRGKISCHKVNICFIYIQPSECIVSAIDTIYLKSQRIKIDLRRSSSLATTRWRH